MTLRVTKKMSSEELNSKLARLKVRKVLNAKKFCGAVKWNEDGIKYQQKLRNEWD